MIVLLNTTRKYIIELPQPAVPVVNQATEKVFAHRFQKFCLLCGSLATIQPARLLWIKQCSLALDFSYRWQNPNHSKSFYKWMVIWFGESGLKNGSCIVFYTCYYWKVRQEIWSGRIYPEVACGRWDSPVLPPVCHVATGSTVTLRNLFLLSVDHQGCCSAMNDDPSSLLRFIHSGF